MSSAPRTGKESPGALLNEVLGTHRSFMENVHSLMRFLDSELSKRGWKLLRPGGSYGVTRDGYGVSFAAFASWITTHAGLVFVPAGQSTLGSTANTISRVQESGLQVLVFQVRWLDKSPQEPVVWHARLRVEREAPVDDPRWADRKWEDYQNDALSKLEPERPDDGTRSGAIRPVRVSKGVSILLTGCYSEVPVVEIQTAQHAVSLLVEPALAMWSQD
jgi:hypothetical protein